MYTTIFSQTDFQLPILNIISTETTATFGLTDPFLGQKSGKVQPTSSYL